MALGIHIDKQRPSCTGFKRTHGQHVRRIFTTLVTDWHSGTVTLPDGCVSQVDDVSKEFAIALSSHFEIDEIQVFVLLRSFLYNEGPSISSGLSSDKSLVDSTVCDINDGPLLSVIHISASDGSRRMPPLSILGHDIEGSCVFLVRTTQCRHDLLEQYSKKECTMTVDSSTRFRIWRAFGGTNAPLE
ncbi:hypothetical protein EV363DRAFT_1438056 [Boletus edulis]|uniref:Uncharacterized protein n=1 Tax=Boletus edulis BED1 TaxID=1328754 RepID=A0AAD4B9Y7_BOLED|nr:hypothetical protein EV363DRAFT_1438056 [Boletus edulis]KAF8414911.1 hypothetical protein L210DRAFT_3637766 [Boletus edulis BED1]